MPKKLTYEELEQRIQELKQAKSEFKTDETAFHRSEEIYKTIFEKIEDGYYEVDLAGRFTFYNDSLRKFLGYSKDEITGVNNRQYMDEENAKKVFHAFNRVYKTGLPNKAFDWELKRKDGSKCYVEASISLKTDVKGHPIGFHGIARDITERKRTEAALRKSEERFRNVYTTAPLAFVVWDKSTRVVDWNKKAEEIFGWSKEEVVGKNFFDFLIPEKDRPQVEKIVSNLLKGTLLNRSINKNLNKHGQTMTCEWSNSSLHDDNGKIIGAISLGLDITEREQAQEALRESEEEYRNLFSNAQVGLARTRISDGKILSCNEKMAQIFGYANVADFTDEYLFSEKYVDPQKRTTLLNDVIKTGFLNNAEAEFYGRDEGKIWARFDTRIYPDKGYMDDVVVDITERKLAEEALQKSEAKYRSMMEAMVDAIYICSPDYKIEYMNPVMVKRIGRDATGEVCYRVLHGLEQKCDWCVFDEVSKGIPIEISLVSPLDDRTYRVTNMPILNEDGTTSKMTIYRDISDYLSAVSEKEKAKAQLLRAQKMESIGNLAGGIAHDFNNILTSILGYTELALSDVAKETKLADKLQQVYTAGIRARDLVKQILAFARQSEENVKPLQIDKIIKEVLKFMRASIPTTITIKENIESDAIIMGNTTEVHQILMNLCTNAAQAMQDQGGLLEVSLKDVQFDSDYNQHGLIIKRGNYIKIEVSDSGLGIAPEIIDSIFEPYFTTKDSTEGTGMGLALVHGIVESYGGKITVDSALAKGTTFSIYLPVTKERKERGSYKPEETTSGNERILFVDDEAIITDVNSQILERLGYSVTTRTSSVEAWELFRSQPDNFDLVITDMTMPNMRGDELAAKLMSIRPDIPVILCTGFSKNISDEIAKEIGIKAFAYKPIVMADLAKTVRDVLDEAKGSKHI